VSLRIPSSSRSPDHDPHRTIYYLRYPLGRFACLKHQQLTRQVGVIITTGRIRRTLVNKINLLVDSPRSIEASRLALVKAESIFLRRASGCFDYVARPGASACRAAHHAARRAARRRLLRLHRASGYLGTSRGSSRGSSSTTLTTPRVQVPRHVTRHIARLVALLVIDYFDYAARPVALARRAARRAARHRLLRLRRASDCFDTSRGLLRDSLSTTSTMPHVWLLRHVARLVT
jgi:hypothetical protein